MRNFVAIVCLAASVPAASAGYVDTPQCRRDLAATETSLAATLRDLNRNKSGSPAQRCASWRRHVEVMRNASVVYRQCSTGRERQENVGQMDGSIADFLEVVARNCR